MLSVVVLCGGSDLRFLTPRRCRSLGCDDLPDVQRCIGLVQSQRIIIGAFLIAFWLCPTPAVAESEKHLTVVVWAVFGYIDPSTMYRSMNVVRRSCLYCMVMIVLMINLLLAILATTIDDVRGQAERWKIGWAPRFAMSAGPELLHH